jgi:D-hydroxyproline dehydrogenase subunit gamma
VTAETIEIVVDGRRIETAVGASVASMLLNAGILAFRRSEAGEARAPLCGMGVCYECRVTIDGIPHQRACMTTVTPGMTIETPNVSSESR